MIPGAEHAPILIRTLTDLGPEGSDVRLGREVRWRADVTDPDDQRVIWRLAALHYGAGADNRSATLRRIGRNDWRLEVTHTRSNGDGILLALRTLCAATLEAATAALCVAVWGPSEQVEKPPRG